MSVAGSREPASRASLRAWCPRPPIPRSRASLPRPALVRRDLRRTHRGAGRRLGRHRLGAARARLRAHRIGQDARRVPLGPRPSGRRARAASPGVRVLYVSPLKALAVDVERNLRAPLAGIRDAATRLGLAPPSITTALRTGDTPAEERRRLAEASPGHPRHHAGVDLPAADLGRRATCCAPSRRSSSTRCTRSPARSAARTWRSRSSGSTVCCPQPAQRIGLSATVRPLEEVARFLGGARPVTVVAAPADKTLDLSVVVPVEDLTSLGRRPARRQRQRRTPRSGTASGRTWRSGCSRSSARIAAPSCSPTRGGSPSDCARA